MITEIATGLLTEKALSLFAKGFKVAVIDRWTKSRAEQFVATFCDNITTASEGELNAKLDAILEDDVKSECLFDAYRRVALTASPVIGPRVIAVIMANVINENRRPNPDEERLLAVAERLSDEDFEETRSWFYKFVIKLERVHPRNEKSHWRDPGHPDDSGGIEFWNDWGPWAAKLEQFGLLNWSLRLIQDNNRDGNLDYVRIANDMYYDSALGQLVKLVDQVAPKPSKANVDEQKVES